MGIAPSSLAAAFAVLLLVPACGGDATTTMLTIDGTVSVCGTDGDCADLPAAGATVTVYSETGERVDQGTLDSDGELEFNVPEGTYTASLAMPSLGIETASRAGPTVSVSEGGSGELSIALPHVDIASQRPGRTRPRG
jgi:hypothetical protein